MTASKTKPEKTLQELGVTQSEQINALISEMRERFDQQISRDHDAVGLEMLRVKWVGRKSGELTLAADNWLKPAPVELKRILGPALNELRAHVEAVLDERQREIARAADSSAPARNRLDLSLPGLHRPLGTRHLISQVFAEIESIFLSLGYTVCDGPEIETPYYNFDALNIPETHPARDAMDTFYFEGFPRGKERLLRTHTSPMQIHTMEKQRPPVRIIVPGKVYRRDNPDATHSYMFHQVEGLAVDHDITFCDFKGTLEHFVRRFFGPKIKTRFQPSYFPFTEPSADVYVSCIFCGGSGCRICKFGGWIEVLGSGMVDPAVYGFVDYDPRRVSGFAFGIGVDRMAILKYGINDIQAFFQNDVRFLRQFP